MAANTLDWGVAGQAFLATDRVTTIGIGLTGEVLRQSAAAHSANIARVVSALALPTTLAAEQVLLPGSGTLQPLDELGIPLPTRSSGYYSVGYPIQGGGDAYELDRVTKVTATAAEVERFRLDIQRRDADWMKRHIQAALFDNTSWTWRDPALGNLTIQPLANGDSVTYLTNGGTMATADHYVAQSAAISDNADPFPTIQSTLQVYPDHQGRAIITFIADEQVADVEGLTNYVPIRDPDILVGSGTDQLVGAPPAATAIGTLLGKVGRIWVVHWPSMPENYLLSIVDGLPPLRMREYPDAALQGLFLEPASPDDARVEFRYIRYAGFGCRNRVSAMMTFVEAGDTTYDIPTGFETPLAI